MPCSLRAITAVVALASLATGCGGEEDRGPEAVDAASPPTTTVAMVDGRYEPAKVRVLVGDSVTWVNRDGGVPHTAQTKSRESKSWLEEEDFDTHTLTWEEPYTVTFHKPGSFSYHCSFHPSMKGTVEVVTRPLPSD